MTPETAVLVHTEDGRPSLGHSHAARTGVVSPPGGETWDPRTARAAAHEFSNLMTVILGYTQILETDLASNAAARSRLKEIASAASRATALIQTMRSQTG